MSTIRAKITLLFLILLFTSGEVLAGNSRIQVLYFYTAVCPPCEQTTPIVSELSREYPVEGVVFDDEAPSRMPFTVRKGTKADKQQYTIRYIPSIVIVKDGKIKQVLSKENDIKYSRTIIKGVELGALTVTEAILDRSQHTKTIMGWIKSRGEYVKGAPLYLSDLKNSIEVKPWLPLEATKSPSTGKKSRLMSDVINKQVILEGAITKTGGTVIFTVEKELNIE